MKHGSADVLANEIQNNIESFASSLLCNRIIIFQDYKGSDFRKAMYPEYKGNRKDRKPSKFQDQIDAFFKKLPTITKMLNMYYPLIKFKGIEADDTMYYVSKLLGNCVILSTDADLLQLDCPQFAYTKGKYITLEDQGCDNVGMFIQAKAIAGDTSDNIKGLERVGLKTAVKYLNKYNCTTFTDLRDSIPKNSKSKIEQRILNGTEVVTRNLRLVDIGLVNDEIITEAQKEEIKRDINEFYD